MDMRRAIASPPSMPQHDVRVSVENFYGLIQQAYSLRLDHYQRPYVWSADKVRQLLDDLSTFRQQKKQAAYYMGTLLLHRQDDSASLFVIDGQQRLSSLAVLYHALSGDLPKGIDFHYRSPLSAANLKQAQQTIADMQPLVFDITLFAQLCFTVITVDHEDLAFTFFDTQNNRGVPLAATDLLKAYHLRAIEQDNAPMQQDCARRWESIQLSRIPTGPKSRDFATDLFGQYLWRARNWRGQKHLERESHDALLATFQHRSVANDSADRLPLYPAHANQLASYLSVHCEHDYQLDLMPLQLGPDPARLPFSLRQPIHKGLGFFLYAQKYAALLDELLYQPPSHAGIAEIRDFHQRVVKTNSPYLQELFNLAMLMHVDRFGYTALLPFAHMTEMLLGGLRLEKKYLFKEGPIKYLREARHNLLDVIAAAYRPDEVMDFLKSELAAGAGYRAIDKIESPDGVQGRYLAAVRNYYLSPERLPAGLPGKIAQALLNNH